MRVLFFQIKVGTTGAKECGDYEEWFNYRMARAAPESCADFMGSFVADKTKSEFIKGGKWLVWKFEVCVLTSYLSMKVAKVQKRKYSKSSVISSFPKIEDK